MNEFESECLICLHKSYWRGFAALEYQGKLIRFPKAHLLMAIGLMAFTALANEPIKIEPLRITPQGARIEFNTETNRVYVIQESNDLIAWSAVTTNMPGTGENIIRYQPLAQRRFYRIVSVAK